jgi:hypothetical protein
MPPTVFCTLPSVLSAFPSASVLASPVTLPTVSLILPFACFAAPSFHFYSGGAKPGAGRRPGVTNNPQLRDQLSQEQIDALVAKGIEKADAGDSLMLKFLLGEIFGKAPTHR